MAALYRSHIQSSADFKKTVMDVHTAMFKVSENMNDFMILFLQHPLYDIICPRPESDDRKYLTRSICCL